MGLNCPRMRKTEVVNKDLKVYYMYKEEQRGKDSSLPFVSQPYQPHSYWEVCMHANSCIIYLHTTDIQNSFEKYSIV